MSRSSMAKQSFPTIFSNHAKDVLLTHALPFVAAGQMSSISSICFFDVQKIETFFFAEMICPTAAKRISTACWVHLCIRPPAS